MLLLFPQGEGGAQEVEGRETGAGACVRVIALILPWMHLLQVISDTDKADARYCGGSMTGNTGWVCW